MMVSRRESGEEKESLIREARWEDILGGVGVRVEKNWWLDQAMLAWLKREAACGWRALVRMRSLVVELKDEEPEWGMSAKGLEIEVLVERD